MNRTTPVAVAGAGVISAIGNNIRECLAALETGRAGMGDITWLDTVHRGQIPVAEVKAGNDQLKDLAGVTGVVSRTGLLSFIAAREALDSAGIPRPAPRDRTA
jgi:3-oxoacyl-[acyl-carrier-protein] synthase-1